MDNEATTLKEWVLDTYREDEIKEIEANIGRNDWIAGHNETCPVYEQFDDDIWRLLHKMKERSGYKNVIELLNYRSAAKDINDAATFENVLVGMAIETIAAQILGKKEVDNGNF